MRRAGVAALAALLLLAGCDEPNGPRRSARDADGGAWATWVLASGSALRPPPPPSSASHEAREEIASIIRLQADADRVGRAGIQEWGASPTAPWTREAVDLLEWYWALLPDVRVASPARSARIMALLHVAMYDALVATWDAKYTYNRAAPYLADSRVRALDRKAELPSYPSEHAAAAAAAAEVLAFAFPQEDAARFQQMARAAGESRIIAGMAYPSDVEAGIALGRAVARQVIQRGLSDGSDAAWNGEMSKSESAWRPTPPRRVKQPFDPMAGRWRTWVLRSGDQFRPGPPPALGSAAFSRDLQELRRMPVTRTLEQTTAARWWATDAPSARWELFALEEVQRSRLAPLRAARAHALISVAMYDAFVACWDAKFHYGLMRPITADSALLTVFATPPFPSYPSGHSTISSAAGEVFAHVFPGRAAFYRNKAEEASLSRVWGGVHYRFDVISGEELGHRVGSAVVEHARTMAGPD